VEPAINQADAAAPVVAEEIVVKPGDEPWRLRSGMLTGIFILGVVAALYFAKAVLIPIALALLINLLLAPIVRVLRCRLRLPEELAAGLVLIALLLGVGGGAYSLSAPAARWVEEMPLAIAKIDYKLQAMRTPVDELQEAAKKVQELAEGSDPGEAQPVAVAVQGPSLTQMFLGGTMSVVAGLVVTIALLYFLLASNDTLLRQAISITPRLRDKKRVVEIVREMEDDVSYYLLTISLINAGQGVAIGVAMYLLGMPNPILWGVMATVFNYVPFLGAVSGISIVAMVALITFDDWWFLLPPLTYLLIHTIEAQFVTPTLLARRLTLNPVAVFLALIIWTWLWGIAGALLAVPLLATFKICCDHIEPMQPVGAMLGR
jgi:predicted PurR-regulated permease PerM